MPELRKDPIIRRWIIISTERARRPNEFKSSHGELTERPCPFCQGHEGQTPPEIYALRDPNSKPNQPGWNVRVVPSIAPVLKIEGKLERKGRGLYDMMNGIGAHEIIIEAPEHVSSFIDLNEEQIADNISVYIDRINELQKDERFKYVLLFKNHGLIAGSARDIIRHSRSQLIATPVNPKRVKEELQGARWYFEYKERCIFCDIIKQELDTAKRIVVDTPHFLAFTPFASRFPFEIWILPKQHSCDFASLNKPDRLDLAKILKVTLAKLSKALGDPPYSYILHTAPFRRPKAGYWRTIEEDFHWHIEIMPRLTRVAGFEWGTGFYINPTPPEEAANYLRQAEI